MKLFSKLLAALLFGSLLFTSCHPKDRPASPALSVDKTTVTQAATSGTATIAVSSNTSWKVTSSQTWATVSPGTGSNNGNVTVTMSANDGTAVRTADITVAASESGSSLTPQVVKVTQAGAAGSLTNFSPTAGPIGSTLTINGLFGASPIVKINGTAATNVVLSTDSKTITCTVPTGATSGKVTVTFGNTTLTSANDFVFYGITSFLPTSLPSNDQTTRIVLTGTYDGTITPVVKINGTLATVTAHSSTSISITLPVGATDGKITVDFGGKTYTSTTDFVVTNRWVNVSNGHGTQYFNAAVFVINYKIYQGLGTNSQGTLYNSDFKIFDPTTNTWSQGPVVPITGLNRSNPSVMVLNNIAYLGFGTNSTYPFDLSDWWSFDPTGTWTQLTSYSAAGYGGLGFVINTTAYAGLPYYDAGIISQFDLTGNSNKGSWISIINNASLKLKQSSCFVLGDNAYILGGSTSSSYVNSTFKFSPTSGNTLTAVANFPVIVAGAPVFSLNGFGYAIYGQHTYRFNPGNTSIGTWSDIQANLPVSIDGVYNAQVVNGVAYVINKFGVVYKFIP